MKKLLGILVLGLLFCGVAKAEKTRYSALLKFWNSGGAGLNWIDYNFGCVDKEKALKNDWSGDKEEFGFLEIEGEKIGAERDKVLFYSVYLRKENSYMVPFSTVAIYEDLTGEEAIYFKRTYNWFTPRVYKKLGKKYDVVIHHILHEHKEKLIDVQQFTYERYYYELTKEEKRKFMTKLGKAWKESDEKTSALSIAQLTTDLYNRVKTARDKQEELFEEFKVCSLYQK